MHKEGLETYNDLIKTFILLLCTSIRQYIRKLKLQLLDYNWQVHITSNLYDQLYFAVIYMYIYQHNVIAMGSTLITIVIVPNCNQYKFPNQHNM